MASREEILADFQVSLHRLYYRFYIANGKNDQEKFAQNALLGFIQIEAFIAHLKQPLFKVIC